MDSEHSAQLKQLHKFCSGSINALDGRKSITAAATAELQSATQVATIFNKIRCTHGHVYHGNHRSAHIFLQGLSKQLSQSRKLLRTARESARRCNHFDVSIEELRSNHQVAPGTHFRARCTSSSAEVTSFPCKQHELGRQRDSLERSFTDRLAVELESLRDEMTVWDLGTQCSSVNRTFVLLFRCLESSDESLCHLHRQKETVRHQR